MRPYRRLVAIGLAAAAVCAWLALASATAAAPPAGPPYPDAVAGQRVYDHAGIFSPAAIAQAERTILAVEQRTGAQIAVYTQVKPESDSLDKANQDALDLMNQWGVGRKGFDDGLVILFDMQTNLRHGQVSLYAGSGFKAAFLTDSDRQAIFDNEMTPRLKNADFDGALTAALQSVDSAATPAHADELNRARILNAIVGLGALVLSIWLVAFVMIRWYTHGRDPIYVDDNSVLMPAPPDGLTPAMATLLMDDRTSSRTVSAAMVDLAARGLIRFRQEEAFMSKKTSVGVTGKASTITTPEAGLYSAIAELAEPGGFVESSSMPQLAPAIGKLGSDLETLSVEKGWLTGKPTRVVAVWFIVAVAEGLASIPLFVWTVNLGASGGLMGGFALIVAAVITG
ncbi:MAG: TPM domain-containing protein, partial [Candidatus Limnocylindrales bacterium]